jgi:hypothetical protein
MTGTFSRTFSQQLGSKKMELLPLRRASKVRITKDWNYGW